MNNNLIIDQGKLLATIISVVQSIELELKELNGTGIFFVPELYLAFQIGKTFFTNQKSIFGTEELKWVREKNLGNGGPSDLIFETPNETVVFEFKISSTWNSYAADIRKLQRLETRDSMEFHKYFVALIDTFRGKEDPRLSNLKQELGVEPIASVTIPVNYSRYKSEMDCLLALFKI
ncbi:MAG: hypothetical protein PSV36_19075 [Algoriphagus sp.]|nr:hypothetical protein [Algoriphagus sp.]